MKQDAFAVINISFINETFSTLRVSKLAKQYLPSKRPTNLKE